MAHRFKVNKETKKERLTLAWFYTLSKAIEYAKDWKMLGGRGSVVVYDTYSYIPKNKDCKIAFKL